MKKIPLIAVIGPTASGKTALSIELAKLYDGEIISADSMQIYKKMNIGTAKPTIEEMQGIPHHMLDFLELHEDFSVALFTAKAREIILDIHTRGKIPIVVGGTGLYINSLIDNIEFAETTDDHHLREQLKKQALENGNQFLLDKLYEIDEEAAKTLHPNNINRIVRALELYQTSGITMTEQKRNSKLHESPFAHVIIGLNYQDRSLLYQKIDARVDIMINNGLIGEAKQIFAENVSKTASQAIGYKELRPYFAGEIPLETAIEQIKMESRRYAKRQITWFKRREDIHWFYVDEEMDVKNIIKNVKFMLEYNGLCAKMK